MLASTIRFFLENKPITFLFLGLCICWGLVTAPFDFGLGNLLPRDSVAVDAIPDLGENQQIVFTNWPGRSPQDVEDQITYPLTAALLGVPGVHSVRSNSMFGFSSIYLIFEEGIEFYWSRSRLLEKLNSLSANTLPEGVQPTLGPDATALGQIFWYTIEGRDPEGNPTGGWDLHELRSTQDFYVRYGLSAANGVSEVASIGGFVKEYQIDVDPDALRAAKVTLDQLMNAVRKSNLDIGAQTMEINLAEYFVRGLGYIKNLEDLENTVVAVRNNTPLRVSDVAKVNIGPANRRGVLDKSGTEAVGGVVVARYGSNPLEVIENVKAKIAELAPGLPSRELADGTMSQLTIVPFYDRTQLINETLGTLREALTLEILITIVVILWMLFNLRAGLLVSGLLPVAVLMCFVAMRYFGVDANIVALSGIAIAIGTMVDMGIVLTESITLGLAKAPPGQNRLETIFEATHEVAGAVITAVATTIVSFIPVFAMEAAEGKLFRPLAFTKTFALLASILLAVTVLPAMAHSLLGRKAPPLRNSLIGFGLLAGVGIYLLVFQGWLVGFLLLLLAFAESAELLLVRQVPAQKDRLRLLKSIIYGLVVAFFLSREWLPLGLEKSLFLNFFFVALLAGSIVGFFWMIIHFYENILRFLLTVKWAFLLLILAIVGAGTFIFLNVDREFLPDLDEGSFLLMPTAMPHSGMQENQKNLRLLDMAVTTIPEVETVVGKLGRADTPLDPAPINMYENVILYKSEYKTDADGHRLRFAVNRKGEYLQDEEGELIPDARGQYYRQWRDHIQSPDDIWQEIVAATRLPGVTSAPKLQPIETRLIMLQTGMRAPMGIKVNGPDLETIQNFGIELEKLLQEVPGVKKSAVFADRIIGKPYLKLLIDREAIARYGLQIADVQLHIQAAIGGMKMTETVEGRERYAVRVRYPREFRNDPAALSRILVSTPTGAQLPLSSLVNITYEQGPQSIKSEDGFLQGYVLFDKEDAEAEVTVVERAQDFIQQKIADQELLVPAGVSYRFAGTYEQQQRANKRLFIVLPIALLLIALILYLHFRSITITLMVYSGVAVAFAGGFLLLGAYGTDWFLNIDLFGLNLRDLFQVQGINLSVAVWVGFLALFGIATDDGVLVATFLRDSFRENQPASVQEVRDAVVQGGLRRVRPAMMTTATTILALLPVLTATGRGADIMIPMAIPTFGGMLFQVVTMFTVPVLWAIWWERKVALSPQGEKEERGERREERGES